MKRICLYCGMGLAAALFAGCQTAKVPVAYPEIGTTSGVTLTNLPDRSLLQPPEDLFVLGPGDQLEIEVMGNAESRAQVTVGLDGKIYYSLLPGIDVWGMTVSQAQARVEQELGRFVRENRIALSLRAVNSKRVWLLG